MILSRKYKEAMDKITLSDEMREKIMANARSQRFAAAPPNRKYRHIIKYGSYAACFLLCCAAIVNGRNFLIRDTSPVKEEISAPAAVGDGYGEAETKKGNTSENGNAEKRTETVTKRDTVQNASTAYTEENTAGTADNTAVKSYSRTVGGKGTGDRKKVYSTGVERSADDTGYMPMAYGAVDTEKVYDTVDTADGGIAISDTPLMSTDKSEIADEFSAAQPAGDGVQSGTGMLAGIHEDSDDEIVAAGTLESSVYSGEGISGLAQLRSEAGYDFKIPTYIPFGYVFSDADLRFGSFIQVVYTSDEDELTYRTGRIQGDISGDYNKYAEEYNEVVDGNDTAFKGSDGNVNIAVWEDGEDSYSISSRSGIDKDETVRIIESVDYEEQDLSEEESNEAVDEADEYGEGSAEYESGNTDGVYDEGISAENGNADETEASAENEQADITDSDNAEEK